MDRLQVEFDSVGPAVLHNLFCWICRERPAVYFVNEREFHPCWSCQPKRKNWWQRMIGGAR